MVRLELAGVARRGGLFSSVDFEPGHLDHCSFPPGHSPVFKIHGNVCPMKFTKMHGLGNDYVYVNCFEEQVADAESLAREISDRHRGVGSDGLILIRPSSEGDVRMEMYNADGSRAQMCGNGIRCVAKYVYEHDMIKSNPMRIETDAGVKDVELILLDGRVDAVRVDMGAPLFAPAAMPTKLTGERIVERDFRVGNVSYKITCVSLGNPHVVIFCDDVNTIDLAREGAAIESHGDFPQRTNVHFVEVLRSTEARMISWERGSGATQACGTGACAVGVAGVLTERLARRCTIHLPGGALEIDWADDDHVHMTGPATEVFSGEWQQFVP